MQSTKFHLTVLRAPQQRVLARLGPILTSWGCYLAGGTAVALRLGHRHSVDLDWFTRQPLREPLQRIDELRRAGVRFKPEQIGPGTLFGLASGVRVSILQYRYPLLKRPMAWPAAQCQVASLEDLAAMKVAAIVQRGRKRDFVDLYALVLRFAPLPRLLACYQRKYRMADIGHVYYALIYFEDADHEQMPKMLWKVDWRVIKSTFREWLRQLAGSRS